jgi:rubrerythrin
MDHRRDLARLLDDLGEPLDQDNYDWSVATRYPLSDEEVFQLTYASQVEWGTEGTFASLNITHDPIVKRFLGIWLVQEIVHANLLARLLEENGHTVEPLHRTKEQQRAARRGKLINRVVRAVVGSDFFGVHMTWGAVNELTTLRFYGVIRDRTTHPLLAEILTDVMKQEAAHYAFYRQAAFQRLADNPRGQRIVRFAMRKLWSIVGTGLRSREDADRLVVAMLDGEDNRAASIDGAIERIPGMQDVRLLGGYLDSARDRMPTTSAA